MMVLVLAVGALVALLVAGQVVRPIHDLVDDVRQIAMGDLSHRTRSRGGGEVMLLGRAIDRMTRELSEAQEAKLELSIRDRELDLAASVRESLLPLATPVVAGYDLGAAFLSSPQFGGDFHDFIELSDGRVGLLACDVSGRGVPAALVGSTARAYMRSELARGADLRETLQRINRWLAADVRRGMYVTAIYALIDPGKGTAQVVCAGHKIPVLRFTASDGRLRALHPEGIALGLDKGPVFDRRLQLQESPLEPGDRLLLANSAPVRIQNAEGSELGEKALFGRVLKHAHLDTQQFLKAMKRDFEQFAGEGGVPFDVSLVTIARVS
jgi:sigma-B regulation protein RsbU (phosphoserine phosphatase)